MADYTFELVGKIGSMALIRKEDQDIDYNIFSRLGRELKPGMIWVTSGATEIGRLDYIRRTGKELTGDPEQDAVNARYLHDDPTTPRRASPSSCRTIGSSSPQNTACASCWWSIPTSTIRKSVSISASC